MKKRDTRREPSSFPFTEWELAAMSAALYFYADTSSWTPPIRDQLKSLAHRIAMAKPGVVHGPRTNAVYARKE